MRTRAQSRAGFTLIEILAVLILSSVVLVFAGMLLVTSTEVYISNKDAAEDSQKIQVAMNRLVKELTFAGAGTVTITSGRTVQWTSVHPDRFGEGAQTATWNGTSGSSLSLQLVPLLDNVGTFAISLSGADAISITLSSSRSTGVTHSTIVHPRYEL